ncbi:MULTISPECIES: hypothetical protein [Brevundimonas]|uniref:hypothetical protein n=1 Tax=Brevundimonas TaxID=41275 RepID=UPI000F02B780|nr:hypothetical protein [Brevundimonas lutea]
MNTRLLTAAALSALMLGAAACSDTDDDVVQAPAPGAETQPVDETAADIATTQAAVALGMTREQLEDADLLSAETTDLGDVETLIVDANNQVTHLVIELEGPGDPEVVVPIGQVRSHRDAAGEIDLQTNLTAEQLQALPAWTGAAPTGTTVMAPTSPNAALGANPGANETTPPAV